MEFTEQNKQISKIERLIDTENRLTSVRGQRGGTLRGWVKKVKGLSINKLIDNDNSEVITRGTRECRKLGKCKGG